MHVVPYAISLFPLTFRLLSLSPLFIFSLLPFLLLVLTLPSLPSPFSKLHYMFTMYDNNRSNSLTVNEVKDWLTMI